MADKKTYSRPRRHLVLELADPASPGAADAASPSTDPSARRKRRRLGYAWWLLGNLSSLAMCLGGAVG